MAERRRVCGLLKENRPATSNSMLREMQHSDKIRRQGLQSALHGHSSLQRCRHRKKRSTARPYLAHFFPDFFSFFARFPRLDKTVPTSHKPESRDKNSASGAASPKPQRCTEEQQGGEAGRQREQAGGVVRGGGEQGHRVARDVEREHHRHLNRMQNGTLP